MKNNLYLTIAIVYLAVQLVSGGRSVLTNHDFCMKQAGRCSGRFKYECKPGKCSVDKQACEYFTSMAKVVNSYRHRVNYHEERKRFNTFKSLIKKCPVIKYEWKAADFCLNKLKDCKKLDTDVITGLQMAKTVDCPCSGKHSYVCGKNVCSVDGTSCDHYQKIAAGKLTPQLRLVSDCARRAKSK